MDRVRVFLLIFIFSIISVNHTIGKCGGIKVEPEWSYETSGDVLSVATTSDGHYVVVGSDDGKVYFFNRNGNLLWSYKIGGYVTSIAVSSDGRYIVAGSEDGKVYFFDKSGKLLWSYRINSSVYSVAITPDGEYVVAGSGDGCVYFFNKNGSLLWRKYDIWIYAAGGSIELVAISSDGKYVVAGGYNEPISFFDGRHYKIYFFDSDGKLLWSYETGNQYRSKVISVTISSDGRYIVAGSKNGKVYFFDKSGKLLWSYGTGNWIKSVAITSNGRYVVAGSYDDKIYFFNRDGNLLWSYETGGYITSVAMSSDGKYVVAGSGDHKVYFFDRSGKLLWSYKIDSPVCSVAITSDGNYVVVGSCSGKVYFFDSKKAIYGQTPRPKLRLIIQTDTELREGETRYSRLIVKNIGNVMAQNIIITLVSKELGIYTKRSIGDLQPQESEEVPFYIEAKYSGQYKIFAKAEYTDGLNKYIEITEQTIIINPVLNNPTPRLEKGEVSITLRSDVVKAKVGEEFSVTLSITNPIVNPDITAQLILKPPSSLIVTSTEFIQTGIGEYSAVYHVKSGESKAIKIFLKPNSAGEFVIRGEVLYYFDNDKNYFKKLLISERIAVVDETEAKQTVKESTNQIINKTLGFEIILAVIAITIVLILKNKYSKGS